MNRFQHTTDFLRFVEALQTEYPQAGTGSFQRFTLATVLRQLGLACLVGGEGSELAAPPSDILGSLGKALRGAPSKRQHLCPLNLAADFPTLSFGPNQVRTFSPKELDELFDVNSLRRAHPSWSVDSRRFSEFTWLIVEEEVVHKTTALGQRRLPGLFENLNRDLGQIEPYHTGLPTSVEDALFVLLIIPWEEIVQYDDIDWRGFQVPWVYTIDSDVFARRLPAPSPDSLAWETEGGIDSSGNEYEYDRPIAYRLDVGSDDVISHANDATWNDIVVARQTSLFARPVAHFFLRGFQATGIDEFLAHISTIEAALGQPEDHIRGSRKKVGGKDPGATQRVVRRIMGLLNDRTSGQTYLNLFGLRSDFLHGKQMASISGADRKNARTLARKIVCALIDHAASDPRVNREMLLDDLLNKGEQLTSAAKTT